PLRRLVAGLFELGGDEAEKSSARLYDQDQDTDPDNDVDLRAPEPAEPAERRRRTKAKVIVPAPDDEPVEQLAIDLGPGAKASPWKLPPLSALERAETHEVDKRAVEERGRVLEAALAQHGVETRLV